jgi:tetratricopeptide (TPR) repeat protein
MPLRKSRLGLLCSVAVMFAGSLSGCRTRTLPDPNDVGYLQPEVLRRNLKYASESLWDRHLKGEITDAQFQALIAKAANELLGRVRIEQVPPSKAWEYAEVFRTAKRWKEAEKFYQIAVKAARDEDRFVNDSLHLAQVMCENGEVEAAIPIARSTFQSTPGAKAPILYGVLLEIVPAARNKGHDLELASLLEGAIGQAEQTQVDPKSVPGQQYLLARPLKIRDAWITIVQLYLAANKPELAESARQRAIRDMSKRASA